MLCQVVNKISGRDLDCLHTRNEECDNLVDYITVLANEELGLEQNWNQVCISVVAFRFTASSFINYILDSIPEFLYIAADAPIWWSPVQPNEKWEKHVNRWKDTESLISNYSLQKVRKQKWLNRPVRMLIIQFGVCVLLTHRHINDYLALEIWSQFRNIYRFELTRVLDFFYLRYSNVSDNLDHHLQFVLKEGSRHIFPLLVIISVFIAHEDNTWRHKSIELPSGDPVLRNQWIFLHVNLLKQFNSIDL